MKYKIINKKKLVVTIVADLIGRVIFLPRLLFKKSEEIRPEEIKNILVIRTAYIGDVVMTLPILKPLRDRFPASKISFLTSTRAKEVLINNPYLNDIIIYDPFWFYPSGKRDYFKFIAELKKKSFDLIVEARGDIRDLLLLVYPMKAKFKVSFGFGGGAFVLTDVVSYETGKHKLEYHLDIARYLGCDIGGIEWGIYLSDAEKEKVRRILDEHDLRGSFITAHPGARHPLRRWLVPRYALLYDTLIDKYNIPIVILGSPDEMGLVEDIINMMEHKPISFVGKLSLRETAHVLSGSILFICNNSAPMHIAASMKTPTVVIHGPSKKYWDAPYGNINRIVEKDFPCRYSCDENSCHYERYHACMEDIQVEDVFRAVEDIFKEIKI
jgi:ADP-heptose:LPS heptosyltransferase